MALSAGARPGPYEKHRYRDEPHRRTSTALIAKEYMPNMLSVAFLLTPRMKRLRVSGFSLALLLLPGLGSAETQHFHLFPGEADRASATKRWAGVETADVLLH